MQIRVNAVSAPHRGFHKYSKKGSFLSSPGPATIPKMNIQAWFHSSVLLPRPWKFRTLGVFLRLRYRADSWWISFFYNIRSLMGNGNLGCGKVSIVAGVAKAVKDRLCWRLYEFSSSSHHVRLSNNNLYETVKPLKKKKNFEISISILFSTLRRCWGYLERWFIKLCNFW